MTRPIPFSALRSAACVIAVAACGPTDDRGEPAGGSDAMASAADVCASPPREGATLPADATLSDAAGAWTLTVVVEEGEAAGTRHEALLTLERHGEAMRVVTGWDGEPLPNSAAPLYGSTDLDLEAMGSFPMGGLDSTDPAAPGVGVYETRVADGSRPASVLLRLGSAANRREGVALDGGTSVLRVLRITDDGFAGTWRSQVNAQTVASGWFCATPAGEG